MSITKEFNNFIAKAFNGLSAKTLVKELTITSYHMPTDIAANWVYVHIFHVFTKTATLEDMEIFQTVQDWILHIDRTEAESIQREIAELKYCIEYGYKYPSNQLAYIKENALEWYLNHIITLSDFIYVTYIYVTYIYYIHYIYY